MLKKFNFFNVNDDDYFFVSYHENSWNFKEILSKLSNNYNIELKSANEDEINKLIEGLEVFGFKYVNKNKRIIID